MRLNIKFKDNSDNESSFKIYRATDLSLTDKVEIISLSYSNGWTLSGSNDPILKSSNSAPSQTGEIFSIDFDEDQTGSFFYGVGAFNLVGGGSSIEATLSSIQVGETTTIAPTTLEPTTLEPTTLAPTTLAPTTLAPTTLAPTTLVEDPDFIFPDDYDSTFHAHRIIFLQDYNYINQWNSSFNKNYPTGTIWQTYGKSNDSTLLRAEDSENPRNYPYRADNKGTGAWNYFDVSDRGVTWEFAKVETSTTQAPTTLEPTTLAPTTLEPTTLAPTTLEPTTLAPTTTLAPFLWSPSDSTLTKNLWLDSTDSGTIVQSSNIVSQWSDKSGNNNHAIQTNSSKQPTLTSTDGILFDGTDDSFELTSEIESVPLSIYFLAKGDGYFFTHGGNTRFAVNRYSSGKTLYWNNSYGSSISNSISYWHTRYQIFEMRSEGGICRLFINGVQSNKGGISWQNLQIDAIGKAWTTGSSFQTPFVGHIKEILITPDMTSREKIEGYLAHKHGISDYLPTSHSFKSSAPTTLAPTTLAPTTLAPTTIAPTTIAPTTLAPTTIAPPSNGITAVEAWGNDGQISRSQGIVYNWNGVGYVNGNYSLRLSSGKWSWYYNSNSMALFSIDSDILNPRTASYLNYQFGWNVAGWFINDLS